MPDDKAPPDLAQLDNWFGFRPGMTRGEVMEALEKLGLEGHNYSAENLAATVEDYDLEFYFATDGSERLRQVSIDSGPISWNARPVMSVRLDAALRVMEPFGRTPMWEANDVIGKAFRAPGEVPAGPVSDEQLLEEGTLWLPERGLGIVVGEGEVVGFAWREGRDLPAQFAGPLTEAQRELSKRADLEEHLLAKRQARHRTTGSNQRSSPVGVILACVCVGLLAYIGSLGFKEMKLWNTAPTIAGQLVSVEKVPRKKHFDLGPEFLRKHMADDPIRTREMYHVTFLDPTGRPHAAVLEGAEFYVPPREIGEKVQLAYGDGNPPRVKGLSRARDAAFIEYLPWAIAVGIFWVVMQFVLRLTPLTWRNVLELLLAAFTSRSDRDRRELR